MVKFCSQNEFIYIHVHTKVGANGDNDDETIEVQRKASDKGYYL